MERIPIHFAFGSHSDFSAPLFRQSQRLILSYLNQNPEGSVGVVLEDPYAPVAKAIVSLWISNGTLPSDSYAVYDYAIEKGKLPSVAQLRRWKRLFWHGDSTFKKGQLRILDSIAKKFPGRLWVIPEWTPEDELKDLMKGGKYDPDQYLDPAMHLVWEGQFTKALPLYKEFAQTMADISVRRDKRLVHTIDEEIETTAKRQRSTALAVGE